MKKNREYIFLILIMVFSNGWALKDPTRPPDEDIALIQLENNAKSPFVLTGIVLGQHKKVAVINNKTLNVGDPINDAIVIHIYPHSVELKQNGLPIYLQLINQDVLTVPKNSDTDQSPFR